MDANCHKVIIFLLDCPQALHHAAAAGTPDLLCAYGLIAPLQARHCTVAAHLAE
jgi:hypothetical protein